MTARENAMNIIRFGRPERITSGPPCYTISWLGANHEGFDGKGHDRPVGSWWTDVWGVGWHKEQEGVMAFPRRHPLDEPRKLRSYRWPDPSDERIIGRIYRLREAWAGGDEFLMGSHRDTVWEKAYMLVGMENLMAYFHTEPEFAREVCHRVMDWHLAIARHYLALGVEIVLCSDDLGTQSGPLLGPDVVEEFLVPEYRRLFDLYRSRNVMILFHTCGRIDTVVEPMMRLGVDILNPVQATANDLDAIREKTAGRMCLQGGISSRVVYEGPPERIVREVRKRMWQLGRHGGYFCCPDQGLPYPAEHTAAMHRAIAEYGSYPLAPPEP